MGLENLVPEREEPSEEQMKYFILGEIVRYNEVENNGNGGISMKEFTSTEGYPSQSQVYKYWDRWPHACNKVGIVTHKQRQRDDDIDIDITGIGQFNSRLADLVMEAQQSGVDKSDILDSVENLYTYMRFHVANSKFTSWRK